MNTKHQSYIPMSAEELPQQKICEVVPIPEKPIRLDITVDPGLDSLDGRTLGTPRNVDFLFSSEWAWSPSHNRIDNYYLNKRRNRWALWNNWVDDCGEPWSWHWSLIAYAPGTNADPQTVAMHLILEAWKWKKENEYLDHFHWINNSGSLEIADIRAIAREVWGDDSA